MTASDASPAAIASGPPLNVVEWTMTFSMDEYTEPKIFSVVSIAPTGTYPPDSALATVTMSGCTPSCS